jgi:hypothetical protein
MSTKLTDTQLLMLGAAAQRKDRCVAAPPNLKGRQRRSSRRGWSLLDLLRRSKPSRVPTFGGATM